ncbi:hypothetical protein M116_1968 [Bacteroides fragilis str. 3719 A10]|nr:hypothetical protein M116_1968 [Bacteroides fragilis str. 3719 A10]
MDFGYLLLTFLAINKNINKTKNHKKNKTTYSIKIAPLFYDNIHNYIKIG